MDKTEARYAEIARIMNETKNSSRREKIEETVSNIGMIYSQKIKLVYEQIKQLVGNMTLFVKDYNYK